MEGTPIIQIKPLGFPWETLDPFIFCVHHRDDFPKGNDNMGPSVSLAGRTIGQDFSGKEGWNMYHGKTMPGFPYHPHRGFETVTVVKEGVIDHTDSLGAAGRFSGGDVQWMTAGKGVLHSEMFPLVHSDKGNPMELFQIWLNLPKRSKFVQPHFKMLWKENIPVLNEMDSNGNKTEVNVIAGNLKSFHGPEPTPDSWAAEQGNDVSILTIKLDAHATWTLPKTDAGVNRMLYFYKGSSMKIAATDISVYHSVQLKSDIDVILQTGVEDCYLLLLQGKPMNEPVVQYGPFVMNTEEEIREAFAEYQKTQFGGWPWPNHEQAHARESGRFALHADGREEKM
jgi:redox-sensitive bicupin YhaK (pirin superfamily)